MAVSCSAFTQAMDTLPSMKSEFDDDSGVLVVMAQLASATWMLFLAFGMEQHVISRSPEVSSVAPAATVRRLA